MITIDPIMVAVVVMGVFIYFAVKGSGSSKKGTMSNEEFVDWFRKREIERSWFILTLLNTASNQKNAETFWRFGNFAYFCKRDCEKDSQQVLNSGSNYHLVTEIFFEQTNDIGVCTIVCRLQVCH